MNEIRIAKSGTDPGFSVLLVRIAAVGDEPADDHGAQ
jgi:hypothetical protein